MYINSLISSFHNYIMKQKHDDMKNKIIIVLQEDERSYGNQQTGNFRGIAGS